MSVLTHVRINYYAIVSEHKQNENSPEERDHVWRDPPGEDFADGGPVDVHDVVQRGVGAADVPAMGQKCFGWLAQSMAK